MRSLSADEDSIMRYAVKKTLLRAADIIDGITEHDVLEAQAELLATGSTLEQVAKVDRAMLAASHLRACAKTAKGPLERSRK